MYEENGINVRVRFHRREFDDGLYEITGGFDYGLFTDDCGMWYDDDEVERAADSLGSFKYSQVVSAMARLLARLLIAHV